MSDVDYKIEHDEDGNRTKITIHFGRKWGILSIYTLALAVWLTMLISIVVYLVGAYSPSVVLTLLLLLWLAIWLLFGRFLWKRWQHAAASREIIFIDEEQIIYRRPVSILGHTAAYDKSHASAFYFSDVHACLAFDYAYQHVYFGHDLPHQSAAQIIERVNIRWFPDPDDVVSFD